MRVRLRTSLLATVPFVLLFNADRVQLTTRVYQDISGTRIIQVSGDSSLSRQLRQWARETTRSYQQDRFRVISNRAEICRSAQVADLDAVDDVDASALDIVQHPFSLKTTYHFRERLRVDFTYGTDKELAPAPLTNFEYVLVMPGRVTQAGPAGARIQGDTVHWTLNAARKEMELSATAEAWRWDLILVLLYVLGYVAYRTAAFLARQARMRPRKI